MKEIRNQVRKRREDEVTSQIDNLINTLGEEGLTVEFGNIGKKTTYALLYSPDHEVEYVGYTFVMNMKFYNENIGKLKALTQAIARKETIQAEE